MNILLKRLLVFLVLAGFVVGNIFAEEKVMLSQDFKELKDLSAAGWKIIEGKGPTKWEITKDGFLKVTHCTVPYKGGRITKSIPAVRKGYLEFDAMIGGANNSHLSLQVFLFGQMTAFNGYGTARINWNRYQGPPVNNWFNITSRIAPDKWHKFRIFFDADEKSFEFYMDNMDDPVNFHEEVPFDITKDANLFIGFGDYGLCPGEVVNYVNNIRLVEIK
jgi:hypothetical protein